MNGPYTPPNHWSKQEPDGLCQWEKPDPITGEPIYWRGPWPADRMAMPYGGTMPVSTRHHHTTDCMVRADEVLPPRQPSNFEDVVVDPDGYVRFDVWVTNIACRDLRIAIFTRDDL